MKRFLAPTLAILLLGGCVTDGRTGPNQTMGTLLGAAAGGLAGSYIGSGNGRLAAVAIGTLAGAYAGSQIGASADQPDRQAFDAPPPRRHPNGYDPGRRAYGRGYADGYDDGYGNAYRDRRY